MEGVVVNAATGALGAVLGKLAIVLGDKYKRFKGVRGEIKYLSEELAAMAAFLLKKSEDENPDAQERARMIEVRELSYDIEDSIDEFMLRVDDKSADGFINKCKCKSLLSKIKARYRIAKKIKELKIQVKEVAERNARYRTPGTIHRTNNATFDPRSLVVFEDCSKHRGMDGPKSELIKFLRKEDGPGGMGKTTLANQVYQDLKEEFDCEAFVSVSRNPDFMTVLRNILSQASNEPYANTEAADIQQLIRKIADYLKDKRYLIVVDDIWKEDAWETIKYAFSHNSMHSRIITTTRIFNVAQKCCTSYGNNLVYKIRPLNLQDSKRLFYERIFGSEDKCPPELMDISAKILKKCDGLPLAIISISGLLAGKTQPEEWRRVLNSIGRALGRSADTVERMMNILSLSYFDLPHHLKTCLLYLSVFPEDYVVDKKRLIRRWIAEGFIHKVCEAQRVTCQYELGERCFNELINRSLIQPCEITKYGEVLACRVHDTIRDFIVSKSVEENFAAMLGNEYQLFNSDCKVRRLSLHSSNEENVSSLREHNLSNVRSLTVFQNCVQLDLPSLLELSFLRVVDFEGCSGLEGHRLANIWNLSLLKYLSLKRTEVRELPEQIEKLQYLETLNLEGTKLKELPSSIVQLGRLVNLMIGRIVKLPNGIGIMTGLEELEDVNVFKQSINFAQELGQLKKLRILKLALTYEDSKKYSNRGSDHKEHMDNILSSICKLGRLHSIYIDIDISITDVFSLELCGHALPCGLRKFIINKGFVSRVPNWIRSLVNLQVLSLRVMELEVKDLRSIGCLPALEYLQLVAHQSFPGTRIIISGNDGFRCLRRFDFGCAIPVAFETGAMPKLEELELLFSVVATQLICKGEGDFPFGIKHLSSLQRVTCTIYQGFVGELYKNIRNEVDEAERNVQMDSIYGVIIRAVHSHPKPLKLGVHISCYWNFYFNLNYFSQIRALGLQLSSLFRQLDDVTVRS